MVLMYQVGAGTRMFALGKTLSLSSNAPQMGEVLQQIHGKYKYKLLQEFQEFQKAPQDGVSFWARIHNPGTEVVTQPVSAGTAKLQNAIRGVRIYETLVNHT